MMFVNRDGKTCSLLVYHDLRRGDELVAFLHEPEKEKEKGRA
jgi:hypothetical protein